MKPTFSRRACLIGAAAGAAAMIAPTIAAAPDAASQGHPTRRPVPSDQSRQDVSAAFTAVTTAAAARVHSDRRPHGAGVYDAVANKTFIVFMGYESRSFAQAYDHTTGVWNNPVFIGASLPEHRADRHNYPVIALAPDGHLLVAYGCHGTPMKVARSAQPHSVFGAWQTQALTDLVPHASYPTLLNGDTGEVYLFYRDDSLARADPTGNSDDDRPEQYVVTTNSGQTWMTSKQLTGNDYIIWSERADNMDEVYLGGTFRTPDSGSTPMRFHFAWSMAGGGEEGHQHVRYCHDIHYAYFQPSNHHFYAATGKDLGTSINQQEMARDTLAFTTDRRVNMGVIFGGITVTVLNGKPIIVFDKVEPDPADASKNIFKGLALYWDGQRWVESYAPEPLVLTFDAGPATPSSIHIYARADPSGIQVWEFEPGRPWLKHSVVATTQRLQKLAVIDYGQAPVLGIAEGETGDNSQYSSQYVVTGDVYAFGPAS